MHSYYICNIEYVVEIKPVYSIQNLCFDFVHYDVIIWGSPTGAMHSGVFQDLDISQTGYITRKCSEKMSRHIIKVCETVIKERRNLLYYWLCHTS